MNKDNNRFHRLPLRLDVAEVGASLAHANDYVLAKFLEAFCTELLTVCESRYAAEMQIAYTGDYLSDEHRNLLANLVKDE